MRFFQLCNKFFGALLQNPKGIYFLGKAFIKGALYAAFCRLFRRNVRIQLPFFVYYKVHISGPGSVLIERGCSVFPNVFDGLTVVTLSPGAQVVIGKGCDLGGVTIRCHKMVELESRGLFANCLIQDVLFSVRSDTPCSEKPLLREADAIFIGKRVWLAGQTLVLGGSIIGDDSVLSVGSVCSGRHIPERHLAAGNPIGNTLDIQRIRKFLGNNDRTDC